MNEWRVWVTYTIDRPPQTRESRLSQPEIKRPPYGDSQTFDTEKAAVEYAVMSRLAGNEVWISGPGDHWINRWQYLEERRNGE